MDEQAKSLTELNEAARRVGSTEHVNSVIELAERRAEEIRHRAELDAEGTRRDAVESAKRVFERINALEVPLGELVETLRLEVATVERELEGHVDAEVTAISETAEASEDAQGEPLEGKGTAVLAQPAEAMPDVTPSKPKPGRGARRREKSRQERSTPGEEEPRPETTPGGDESREEPTPGGEEPREERPSEEASQDRPKQNANEGVVGEAPDPTPQSETMPASLSPAPVEAEQREEQVEVELEEPQPIVLSPRRTAEAPEPNGGTEAAGRVRGFFSRFRNGAVSRFPSAAKNDAFITSEGHCAVCQKAFMAGSEEELRLSDWNVNGDVGLCPDCQADRWQLPEGARLPFRRGGA